MATIAVFYLVTASEHVSGVNTADYRFHVVLRDREAHHDRSDHGPDGVLVSVQLSRLVAALLPSPGGWAQRFRLQQLRRTRLHSLRRRPISLLLPTGKSLLISCLLFHNVSFVLTLTFNCPIAHGFLLQGTVPMKNTGTRSRVITITASMLSANKPPWT